MIKYLLTIVFLFNVFISFSQESEEPSIDELNRQLENPLSRFWSLIFQENLSFNTGDLIDGTQLSNVFNFQPSLPVPVGKSKMLLVRPVFPIITVPETNQEGEQDGYETGLGDEGAPELYHPEEQVRFLSQDTNVFAAGVSHLVEKELPGCIIFFGGFDSTALLLAEPGARLGILQIAGDPTMFQMPFFVCTCDHTIMGEEYFAAAAYVSRDPKTRNSLLGQDVIKLIFVVIILVGLFLRHVEVPTLSAWVMQILQVK